MDGIALPKKENKLPTSILSVKEVVKLLMQPDTSKVIGLRNKAILEVFYCTGIRREELRNLKTTDIDFERKTLFIYQGKGKKDRIAPLSNRALSWLERYLNESRAKLESTYSKDFLFIDRIGSQMQGQTTHAFIQKYKKAAKIEKVGTCHLLRHSMATHMLENGASVRYVQEIPGHVSINTTEIYTRVTINKLKEVYFRTEPSASL